MPTTNPKRPPLKMNIVIVLYYYFPYVSGLSVLAKNLAEGLVQIGHKVTVIVISHDLTLPKEEFINGVKVIRCRPLLQIGKGSISLSFYIEILKNSLKADIVNFHLPMADPLLTTLFIPKRKIFLQYHCDLNLGPSWPSKIFCTLSKLLMKLAIKRSYKVITTTKDYFNHSFFKKYFLKNVAIYPPIKAVDLSRNVPYSDFGRSNEETPFLIGFVGRIVYEKGLPILFQTIPILLSHNINFKIVIVGDYKGVIGGSIYHELDPYLKKYPNNIIFKGFLSDSDLISFYKEIDLLVLPSIDPLEAFGLVQVEAMYFGATPIVASNLPGVREVVLKTGHGYIANVADPTHLASQILKVIKNPFKRTTLSSDNLKEFDFITIIHQYETLFNLF